VDSGTGCASDVEAALCDSERVVAPDAGVETAPAKSGAVPTVLRDSGAALRRRACSRSIKGQPSGWPARTSRTVGRGSHPKDRSAAQDPRSGLTAGTDRAW